MQFYVYIYTQFQAQLEELKAKEEWARNQLENTTENRRKAYQRCQELEAENKQLSEQMNKLSGLNDENVILVHALKAQVRKLEQEKETLQNEVQIAKTEVCMYNPCLILCVSWFLYLMVVMNVLIERFRH